MTYNLPKWSQMIVTGKPVTIEQAKDIIFRTDPFLHNLSEYSGGNNQLFNEAMRLNSGMLRLEESLQAADNAPWAERFELLRKWQEAMGMVSTTYVTNDWASCCFIGGPHGWCNPDGRIYFSDNIGKWPSVEEVVEDWKTLVAAFPFLDLTATLMSGESCEEDAVPVCTITVQDGVVTVGDPAPDFCRPTENFIEKTLARLSGTGTEQGLPMDWCMEFCDKSSAAVNKLLKGTPM